MSKKKSKINPKIRLISSIAILLIIVLIIAIAISTFYFEFKNQQASLINTSKPEFPDNYVIRVIDGDTFELYSGDKVRLICINAPELGGKDSYNAYKSKAFLEYLILNKQVRLEKDVSNTDAYGRLLRYVWINDSGQEILVNREMVQKGYTKVFRYGNDTKRCGKIES